MRRASLLYISIAMMDITDKELARQRQTELETQLRHSEKLTALGTLAGGIAHDLNNTLVPIQALSKLVLQGIPRRTPRRAAISRTIYRGQHPGARPRAPKILAFSRKQDMLNEPTDIAARVQEALQMLRASVPSTIEIVERIAPIEPILADASAAAPRVIVNLVANSARMRSAIIAAAWSRDARRSTGRCGNDAAPRPPQHRRYWRRRMSPEIMHRMFEPFFTTKSVTAKAPVSACRWCTAS